MRAMLRCLLLPAILAGCGTIHGSSGPTRPSPEARAARALLVHTIDSMVSTPELRNANWGILVVDPVAAETLYSHNPRRLFIPASNQKLATSAVMLEQLGPNFRFRTVISARGQITDQTLAGNLIIVGRGDPTVSDRMKGDAMAPLRQIAQSVLRHGIHHITGRVVSGGNAFPGSPFSVGSAPGATNAASLAGVDELLFNEGVATIRIAPGANPGDPATIETRPARTYPSVRNLVTTGGREATVRAASRGSIGGRLASTVTVYHDSTTSAVVVRGTIAPGDTMNLTVAQRDPDEAYLAALTEALRERGVVVDEQEIPNARTHADSLFTVLSVPLSEILPAVMKPSQNQIAEVFLRTLGLERAGTGTEEGGRRIVQQQLIDWKLPQDGFVIRDGSGLSRNNLVSPELIVGLLDVMRHSPNFKLFYESLPIGGVDGTIRTRMKGTRAEGNVHAKTGTAAMVRSLSGYVRTADGTLLEFSTLCNDWTVERAGVDRVSDAIAIALAELRLR